MPSAYGSPTLFVQKCGDTADQVPLVRLIGAAVVVDVAKKTLADRDYQIRVADLEAWEARHGRIEAGDIVLLRTGFGQYWPDRVTYMGTDERGQEATLKLSFPGLHPSAARWLVTERDVGAVGIDTPSIDYGKSRLFHAHRELFKANVPAFENVAHLEWLPARGALPLDLARITRNGSPLTRSLMNFWLTPMALATVRLA